MKSRGSSMKSAEEQDESVKVFFPPMLHRKNTLEALKMMAFSEKSKIEMRAVEQKFEREDQDEERVDDNVEPVLNTGPRGNGTMKKKADVETVLNTGPCGRMMKNKAPKKTQKKIGWSDKKKKKSKPEAEVKAEPESKPEIKEEAPQPQPEPLQETAPEPEPESQEEELIAPEPSSGGFNFFGFWKTEKTAPEPKPEEPKIEKVKKYELSPEIQASPAMKTLRTAFPGAVINKDIVSRVMDSLEQYGYGSNSLVATSFCGDDVSRGLEKELTSMFGHHFNMGGSAGFPFGGSTSFATMANHIPDGESCLIVFGPHVGIDSHGTVGAFEHRCSKSAPCCQSAITAADYVASVSSGKQEKAGPQKTCLNAQQNFVGNLLLPFAKRLERSKDKMVELPYTLYGAQKKIINDIVRTNAGQVSGDGKIAVVGGIQINTPEGIPDFFKLMSFEVFDNEGELVSAW
jgi:hypothetical protein